MKLFIRVLILHNKEIVLCKLIIKINNVYTVHISILLCRFNSIYYVNKSLVRWKCPVGCVGEGGESVICEL